ncbi:MAG: tRNA uridine-5-carboxymethylaminomethyl(34) synthesis GTPase MnmE [Mycoplasmataceae bacterium]|nr:tRNA uridine-5-carboxymethylaminomethyl(34) synthesis GTPase MnmE [Mycoplasmataceae bacterium]
MFDNIAAISTGGMTNDPISIIRVSGPDAFDIAKKIFSGKVGNHQTITYGYILDEEQKVDEVLISWFKGPDTFTGQNIVEINAHGGVVNTQRILKLLFSNGARMALNGEFSRRAFLNGKMDLVKAEAIHDLIFSKTEEQATLSVKKFDKKTSNLIKDLQTKILGIVATIETNIDYPEYDDVKTLTNKELIPKLNEVKNEILEIIKVSNSSKYIFDGVKVAIVGKPNAGKSSLLNALLNEEKAIVTDIPGTTRDIVEGSIQLGQVLLKFLDTAGIHSTDDLIEQRGISKSLNSINEADLVIHLIDPLQEMNKDDLLIEQLSKMKPYIKVFNKSDIKKIEGISISAINGNIDELINSIQDRFKVVDLNNEKIVNNTRQLALISSSSKLIEESIEGLESGNGPDVVIIDIRSAWEELGSILGRVDQDDLLDQMFSSFCLGK